MRFLKFWMMYWSLELRLKIGGKSVIGYKSNFLFPSRQKPILTTLKIFMSEEIRFSST